MSYQVSFKGLNDLKYRSSDAFHSLDDGADIREITAKLVKEISNEAASVFCVDRIMVEEKWLEIEWDTKPIIRPFLNAGMYSNSGKLVYSPVFLAMIVNQLGKDALVGILCHEVGHRMNYQYFGPSGLRNSWEDEYCADYIAGLLMRLGKADPNAMIRFYNEFASEGGTTHPPGKDRTSAFIRGYKMIDKETSTVFFRDPIFSSTLKASQTFNKTFMYRKLCEDILSELR